MGCTSDKIIENNNELAGKDCQAAGEKIDYHDERAKSSSTGKAKVAVKMFSTGTGAKIYRARSCRGPSFTREI